MRRTPPQLLRRLAGTAAVSAVAVAGGVLLAAPASAAACSGTSGVTVIVDTGSSISTRCASGDPSSGLQALSMVGFSVTPVQTQPGFVCRIDGFPSSEACVRTPPTTAYWAYWHADRGGSWTYASSGGGSRNPAPGSVEGWRFGSGQQPRSAPPAPVRTSAPEPTVAPEPSPTAKKTTKAPSTPAPTTKPAATSGTGSTGRSTPAPTPGASAPAAPPGPSAAGSPTPSPSASGSPTPAASTPGDGAPTASPTPEESAVALAGEPTSEDSIGTSATTLLAGGALIALVAGGAGFAAWKRRA